jgi:putative ABC transport system permease protein
VKSTGIRVGNWLSQRQAQALLSTPDITKVGGLRDRAILAVLLGCGLRRSEDSFTPWPRLHRRRPRPIDTGGRDQRERREAQLGGDDPVGRLIRVDLSCADSPWVTVVGVVGDIRNPIGLDVQPTIYRPFAQIPDLGGILMVRTESDPMALAPGIRSLIHMADATAPAPRISNLERGVADYVSPQRFTASIFGAFAALGLLLAALGIFGVTRYWVGVRIPEIGVRLALGATRSDVVRLVVGAAAKLMLVGVVAGLAGAVAVQRWIASQLFGVAATDPAVLGVAALTMCLVALAAAFFPARSAGRIDPLTALRQE